MPRSRLAVMASVLFILSCDGGPRMGGAPPPPDAASPTAPDPCEQPCADRQCGLHCGVECGACAVGEACADGRCVCAPLCPEARCDQPDGCDGTCPPCARAVGCAECALRLSVVERDGRFVTLALDHDPPEGATAPNIADLQIHVGGDATLERVGVGEPILAVEKRLMPDPETGRPFREVGEGVVQILVLSTTDVRPIPPGRWLFLRFRLGPAFGDPTGPAVISLVPREQILAPPAADQVLWGSDLGAPVVVWP